MKNISEQDKMKKEFLGILNELNEEGLQRVYEQARMFASADHYRKDGKHEKAKIVNFHNDQ